MQVLDIRQLYIKYICISFKIKGTYLLQLGIRTPLEICLKLVLILHDGQIKDLN